MSRDVDRIDFLKQIGQNGHETFINFRSLRQTFTTPFTQHKEFDRSAKMTVSFSEIWKKCQHFFWLPTPQTTSLDISKHFWLFQIKVSLQVAENCYCFKFNVCVLLFLFSSWINCSRCSSSSSVNKSFSKSSVTLSISLSITECSVKTKYCSLMCVCVCAHVPHNLFTTWGNTFKTVSLLSLFGV